MAKPGIPGKETAGWNAGKNYYSRPFRIADIVIDPEISKIFSVQDKTVEEISRKTGKAGYDRSQPVVVRKGKNIPVDGHTRLAAAKELELDEIPAVEMEFGSAEDAILYSFERQVLRRNLTSSEILAAAQMIHGKKEQDGSGRAAELLAERPGISPATVYQARKIMLEAPEEDLKAVQKGEKSIKSVYTKIKKTKKKEADDRKKEAVPGMPRLKIGKILTVTAMLNEVCRLTTDAKCLGLLGKIRECLDKMSLDKMKEEEERL